MQSVVVPIVKSTTPGSGIPIVQQPAWTCGVNPKSMECAIRSRPSWRQRMYVIRSKVRGYVPGRSSKPIVLVIPVVALMVRSCGVQQRLLRLRLYLPRKILR